MPALKALPSPARVIANRANAAKSTGPRTPEGKARSRGNALKHGLTGEGVALPTEGEAGVAGQFAAVVEELAPSTALGGYFARRVALAMVRTERAARHEAKALANRVRHAADDFDRERQARARAALDRLDDDPHAARRELLALPEGVDLLIETLFDLRAAVARAEPDWSVDHEAILRNACGWRDEEIDPERGFALSRAILGDLRLLSEADRRLAQSPPSRPGASAPLALALAGVILAEIGLLSQHRATLDHEGIALDRAEAADRALFDPGRDATLARRYEAAAAREVRQALDLFHAAEAEPEPVADAPAELVKPIEEVATVGGKLPVQTEFTANLASFGADCGLGTSQELTMTEPPTPPLPPVERGGTGGSASPTTGNGDSLEPALNETVPLGAGVEGTVGVDRLGGLGRRSPIVGVLGIG